LVGAEGAVITGDVGGTGDADGVSSAEEFTGELLGGGAGITTCGVTSMMFDAEPDPMTLIARIAIDETVALVKPPMRAGEITNGGENSVHVVPPSLLYS
jgi:hypothetical protein